MVCAFDEAHTLTDKHGTETLDAFPTFRRAIRQLDDSIFTLFLSTNAQVSTFHRVAADESSNCLINAEFVVPPPFTDLPFDILVNGGIRRGFSLDEAVKHQFMAQFGRPM